MSFVFKLLSSTGEFSKVFFNFFDAFINGLHFPFFLQLFNKS